MRPINELHSIPMRDFLRDVKAAEAELTPDEPCLTVTRDYTPAFVVMSIEQYRILTAPDAFALDILSEAAKTGRATIKVVG